ncbi:MAG: immunity 53 family protein [Bacteroidota bacterium]
MNTLQEIECWYSLQCDGDWEHTYGVGIGTPDNPGWTVTIDLHETELEGALFEALWQGNADEDEDWLQLRVEAGQFKGAGDPSKLDVILRAFLEWSRQHTGT